jgi:hypothetical protein
MGNTFCLWAGGVDAVDQRSRKEDAEGSVTMAQEQQRGTLADRFDVTLEILPNGDLRVFGNEIGYNAAREYFKFAPAFSISKPDEWCHVSIGSDRPATLDDVTNFARAIQARSPARLGIIHAGGAYAVNR